MAAPTNSLSKWLRNAAALRPDATFARQGSSALDRRWMTVEELDARADRHAAHWTRAQLGEGARIAMLAPADPETIAAIAGATRAGLEVWLAPPGIEAQELADGAREAGALALSAPVEFAGLNYAQRLGEAAVLTPLAVRRALWGGERHGAIRLDAVVAIAPGHERLGGEGTLALLGQARTLTLEASMLQAAAGDFARAARLQPGGTVLSLVSLASVGGLVCGAIAPLMSGAEVLWQSPFSALGFTKALAERAPAHLIAPSGIVADLGRAGVLTPERVASLTLVATGDFDPMFDHDLEPDQVLILEAEPWGATRLTRLSQAFGEDPD